MQGVGRATTLGDYEAPSALKLRTLGVLNRFAESVPKQLKVNYIFRLEIRGHERKPVVASPDQASRVPVLMKGWYGRFCGSQPPN